MTDQEPSQSSDGLRYERLDRKISEALEAIRVTQKALRRLERGIAAAREDFRTGVRLADWPRGETVAAWLSLQDHLVGLQTALGDARKEAYRAAAVDDGLSFTEIASITDRTRQVVTRIVKSGEESVAQEQDEDPGA